MGLWAVGSSAVSDHAEYKFADPHALGAESLKCKQRQSPGSQDKSLTSTFNYFDYKTVLSARSFTLYICSSHRPSAHEDDQSKVKGGLPP